MTLLAEKSGAGRRGGDDRPPVLYPMSAYTEGLRKPGHFHLLRLQEGQNDRVSRVIPHRHDFFELIWLPSAHGQMQCDLRTFSVKPGSLFFASPGQIHSWRLTEPGDGEIVSFTPDFFLLSSTQPGLLGRMPFIYSDTVAPILHLDEAEGARMETLFRDLRLAASDCAPGRDDIVRAYLTIILTRLRQAYTRRYSEMDAPIQGDVLTRRFRLALEEHFPEMLEVGDYADLLQVSRSHLNDELRRQVGQSASEIIHQRLLLEAKRLLVHSTLTISEIAYSLRFHDPSYFGRFFRRCAGQTPGRYRDEASRDLLAS